MTTWNETLNTLASLNNTTVEAIKALWKNYCRECSNFDQSPVVSEFCQWNGLKS